MCDTLVGIFHRKMYRASDVGGTAVPATMAEEMQDLGQITPDLVYGVVDAATAVSNRVP